MVSANDLKVKGIQVIDREIASMGEAVITHRGRKKYVVIGIKDYKDYLAYKLDLDYKKALEEIQKGNYEELSTVEDIQNHIDSLKI